MAIVKHPKRSTFTSTADAVNAFISGAGQQGAEPKGPKTPIMVRIAPEMLARIDRGAKRLGISRSAFIVSSTAERLERME